MLIRLWSYGEFDERGHRASVCKLIAIDGHACKSFKEYWNNGAVEFIIRYSSKLGETFLVIYFLKIRGT